MILIAVVEIMKYLDSVIEEKYFLKGDTFFHHIISLKIARLCYSVNCHFDFLKNNEL